MSELDYALGTVIIMFFFMSLQINSFNKEMAYRLRKMQDDLYRIEDKADGTERYREAR
jgi:hypothetical protein